VTCYVRAQPTDDADILRETGSLRMAQWTSKTGGSNAEKRKIFGLCFDRVLGEEASGSGWLILGRGDTV
jgi:hypothetical protein